jgi:N-acetylglucosaminyldiphosphoundecaprenol N-acetyl-beta-D-mannosaminyltransferase
LLLFLFLLTKGIEYIDFANKFRTHAYSSLPNWLSHLVSHRVHQIVNAPESSIIAHSHVDETTIDKSVTMADDEFFSAAETACSPANGFATVQLRGMPIHVITRKQTARHLISCSLENIGGWVVTPNLDILRRYTKSVAFRNLLATSTLNVPDGMPLIWASRVKGQPLTERVNGTDLMVDVCEAAAEVGKSVFFLGGNPGSAEKAAATLKEDFSDLKIAGCHCPEFGFETEIDSVKKIAAIIAAANPDFVFVGLGSPKQDVLINMLRLKLPNVWWLGVGVSFSFIGGEISRAPEWAKKRGLEWFFRLASEPRRLAKRYLLQGIPFFAVTLLVSGFERLWCRDSQKNLDEPPSEIAKPKAA